MNRLGSRVLAVAALIALSMTPLAAAQATEPAPDPKVEGSRLSTPLTNEPIVGARCSWAVFGVCIFRTSPVQSGDSGSGNAGTVFVPKY